MEPIRFDNLTRALSTTRPRRRAILSAIVAAGSLLSGRDAIAGGNNRNKNNKKDKKDKKKKDKDKNPPSGCNPPCFGEEKCCGNALCCPKGTGCEFSLDTGKYSCCEPTRACGESCCPAGTRCCPSENWGTLCCPTDQICHPGVGDLRPACCAPGRTPCGGGCCVNPSFWCNSTPPTCCQIASGDRAGDFYCCAGGLECKPSGGNTCQGSGC